MTAEAMSCDPGTAPRRRSIARRYAWLLCGVSLSLLVSSGASQAWFEYIGARRQIAALQWVQADGAAKEIADWLHTIESAVIDVAKMPWGQDGFGPELRREEFYRLMQLQPAVTDLQAVDALGREHLYVSRRDVDRSESLRPLDEAALLQVSAVQPLRYGRTFYRNDLPPALRLAVFDGQGLIVATVDLRLLGDVVSRLRVGEKGVAYVVDAQDVLIAHPRRTEALRRHDLHAFDAVAQARSAAASQAGAIELSDTVDLRGRPVISTAARIEAPGWLLMVEQPRAEALRPVIATLLRTGMLVAIGALIAVLVGVGFARRMAAPIVALRRATERISSGELVTPIDVRSGDEIEDLASDFNRMTERLRKSYAGLEAKVAERTSQLTDARDKLQVRSAEINTLNELLVVQLDELALRKEEAERASASKTRFLATASHDLRQPMHSISLLVGVLHERMQDATARALADSVLASVSAMESLFASLLDISKLDAGAVRAEFRHFRLDAVLGRAGQMWAPQAEERGLRLLVRPTDLVVRSDEALLERVVGNLLSNAIRYTRRGGVLVAARRRGNHCLLQVWDTGPGIPLHLRETIFEEFFRIDTPGIGSAKGLGLGLSIVQRCAQILGHSVRVESRVGAGSMFELALPSPRFDQGQAPEVALSAEARDTMAGRFVVVVDDDEDNRQALASVLLSWGCHVLAASSTREARETCAAHLRTPDLLITDFRLGGTDDGFQVLEGLREHYEENIPVLVVSASTEDELSVRAAAVGAHVLHKPAGAARLLAAACGALRARA